MPDRFLTSKRALGIFRILAAPFFINDFAFIVLDRDPAIYLADYGFRLVVLALALMHAARPFSVAKDGVSYRAMPLLPVPAAIIAAVLASLLVAGLLEVTVRRAFQAPGWFSFPPPATPLLLWLDLTLGLLLVALNEEIVFRRAAARALGAIGFGVDGIVALSSIAFGPMHWGSGPGRVVSTTLTGAVPMSPHLWSGRLWPPVLAHWIINFVIYSP